MTKVTVHYEDEKGAQNLFSLEINISDKVSTLRWKINNRTGIAVDQQVLTLNGQVLEDDKTLGEYEITEESKIQLYTKDQWRELPTPNASMSLDTDQVSTQYQPNNEFNTSFEGDLTEEPYRNGVAGDYSLSSQSTVKHPIRGKSSSSSSNDSSISHTRGAGVPLEAGGTQEGFDTPNNSMESVGGDQLIRLIIHDCYNETEKSIAALSNDTIKRLEEAIIIKIDFNPSIGELRLGFDGQIIEVQQYQKTLQELGIGEGSRIDFFIAPKRETLIGTSTGHGGNSLSSDDSNTSLAGGAGDVLRAVGTPEESGALDNRMGSDGDAELIGLNICTSYNVPVERKEYLRFPIDWTVDQVQQAFIRKRGLKLSEGQIPRLARGKRLMESEKTLKELAVQEGEDVRFYVVQITQQNPVDPAGQRGLVPTHKKEISTVPYTGHGESLIPRENARQPAGGALRPNQGTGSDDGVHFMNLSIRDRNAERIGVRVPSDCTGAQLRDEVIRKGKLKCPREAVVLAYRNKLIQDEQILEELGITNRSWIDFLERQHYLCADQQDQHDLTHSPKGKNWGIAIASGSTLVLLAVGVISTLVAIFTEFSCKFVGIKEGGFNITKSVAIGLAAFCFVIGACCIVYAVSECWKRGKKEECALNTTSSSVSGNLPTNPSTNPPTCVGGSSVGGGVADPLAYSIRQ